MNQLGFNLSEATAQRDEGIRRVAESNEHFLEVARKIARDIACGGFEVTCDDIRRACPIDPLHPNAYGAIFKSKEWEWTGRFRHSRAVSRHGGLQRVWRLRDGIGT